MLSDSFDTPLGIIKTWVQTGKRVDGHVEDTCTFVTSQYKVYLQPFDLKSVWSPKELEYEIGKGWRWFIEKTSNEEQQLEIFCILSNPSGDTERDSSSGEHLDAIEIENKTHHLHLGTEDGEMLKSRAEISDWMPHRFKDEVDMFKSYTQYIDFGFKTTVPHLRLGEKVYFHFIVAANIIKSSKEHLNERDISTWFAVDQSKKYLDQKLSNTAGNTGLPKAGSHPV